MDVGNQHRLDSISGLFQGSQQHHKGNSHNGGQNTTIEMIDYSLNAAPTARSPSLCSTTTNNGAGWDTPPDVPTSDPTEHLHHEQQRRLEAERRTGDISVKL